MRAPLFVRALAWTAVGAIALALLYVFVGLFQKRALEAQILVGLMSSGALVLGAVLTNVNGRIQQAQLEIEQDLRNKRIPVYSKVAETFMSRLTNTPSKKPLSDAKLQERFAEITPELLLWASDSVIKEWARWRATAYENGLPSAQEQDGGEDLAAILDFESLIYAIRQDLGYSGSSLFEGEILGLFINDIHRNIKTPRPLATAVRQRKGVARSSEEDP